MHNQNIATAGVSKTYHESGRGTFILVLGILSITLLGLFAGIPAWVMGKTDLKKIEAGIISESEKSATKAGMILGIISTVLYLGAIVLGILLVVGINIFAN